MVLLPAVFKDEIVQELRKTINDNILATVNWDDVDISLFTSFPSVEIGIKNPTITGINEFEGDTLFTGKRIDFIADFLSIVKKNESAKIKNLEFIQPSLNLLVNTSGENNYQIKSRSEDRDSSFQFFGRLKRYSINDGVVSYRNDVNAVNVTMDGLDHTGSGNFSLSNFMLATKSSIESLSISKQEITILNRVKTLLDSNFDIDLQNNTLFFENGKVILNDLGVKTSGALDYSSDEKLFMDITFGSENNAFKSFMSIVPNIYQSNYREIEADGIAKIEGSIMGNLFYEGDTFPEFSIVTDIQNARFKFPGKEASVNDIDGTLIIKNENKSLRNTTLAFSPLDFEISDQKIDGNLVISNLFGDSRFEGKLDTRIDLKDLNKALPITDFSIEGDLGINTEFDFLKSQVEHNAFDQINSGGQFKLVNGRLSDGDRIFYKVDSILGEISPELLSLDLTSFNSHRSDLSGNINIRNPLALILGNAKSEIKINLSGNQFDIGDFNVNMNKSNEGYSNTTFSWLDSSAIEYQISIDKLYRDSTEIQTLESSGKFEVDQLVIESFSGAIEGKILRFEGELSNVTSYISGVDTLIGEIYLEANTIDCDHWFAQSEEEVEDSSHYLVPAMMHVEIHSDIGTLIYRDLNISNFEGIVSIKNEKAELVDVTANGLGGKIKLDGHYDTSNPESPAFTLSYDASNLDFVKTYQSTNILQILSPLSRYINGLFDSKFVINGVLGKNGLPQLPTLTAVGFLETRDGYLKAWGPLEKLAEKLEIDELKGIRLRNTINFFELVDGRLSFDEIEINHGGILLKVRGGHSFNEELDYYVEANIPKELFKKGKTGSRFITGLDFIDKETERLGISLVDEDYIQLDISMTGTFVNPLFKITPKMPELSQESIKDILENQAEEELDDIVTDVKDTVESTLDTLTGNVRDTIEGKIDELRDSVEATLENQKDTLIQKAKEVLNEETVEIIDSIFGPSIQVDSIDTNIEKVLEDILKKKTNQTKKGVLDYLKKKKKGNN